MTHWLRSVLSGLESKSGTSETPEELMARWAKEDAERQKARTEKAKG